jgi:hypothetical protein
MLLDVAQNGGGDEIVAGQAGGQAAAHLGGGDVEVHGVEQVDAALCFRERAKAGEGGAGAGDDDPLGEREEGFRVAPAGYVGKGVGADEREDLGGGVGAAELAEGVDGVVGQAVGAGMVELGSGEQIGVFGADQVDHGKAVGVGGDESVALEGLATDGGEEDAIHREGSGGSQGDGDVAQVGRVEAAAEEADAHPVRWPGAGRSWAAADSWAGS